MRIARILTRLNLGGPARQVLASDTRLAARGHEVRILAGVPEPGEGDLFAELQGRGLDVVRVASLRRGLSPARDLAARRALRRELRRFRPDVVHTHASKAGALGRPAARKLPGEERVARVHTFHGHVLEGYFPEPVSRRIAEHERRLARETDRVVAVSHATADDLLRLGVVPEERLVVVQPGVEMGDLLELPPAGERDSERRSGALRGLVGADEGALLVGVVGRLAPVKRPELALEVFETLRERHPRMHLVYVGDGSERGALERRIRALGEEGMRRVHLVGTMEQMAPVLADLDCVLSVSRAEGLPVSLIEAAAAGLPAVATAVGGVPEIVTHERTGFLAQSPDDLTFALDQVLASAEVRSAIGARARLRASARHGPERLAERLEELYGVVCEERRCAS